MAKPQIEKSQAKKDAKQRAKEERAEDQRMKHRQQRTGQLGLYAAVAMVLLVAGYWGYGKMTEKHTWTTVPVLPSPHIAPGLPHPPYNSDPPTSGPHAPGLARWGVYTEPVPKELQVHNLEDGGVVIQYSCQDCADLVKQLTTIAERYDRVILAPYTGLDRKIALTAWGTIDKFDEFDEARIVTFIKAHIGIDHHGAGG
ncbi:hypothetical protein MELA_01112 [Candidatus Methylomirabilis lanthanidiphila]|uniref:DUF3105 domain-containing protein n=1 Tax=Candidatus Methylomirabilis lanthanidiphila TaxID=2211376 RepID=A0A564ZJL6_9BACT|nr:DUF3105 domain-containing protein [Candidatus Methylomirabilis lanthanidiphila]VUZ84738.1 hypothetical protein MELA_01112 [Candidatus Methylomirabilis lanthanidiphila]